MRVTRTGNPYRGTKLKFCEYCNIEFEAFRPKKTKFCSISCWNRSTKPEYKLICNSCGKEKLYKSAQSYSYAKSHPSSCKSCSRKTRAKFIESRYGQHTPFYNPIACQAIDEYGKQHGYNFQHAENGGEFYIKELGYWVDGYDKDKNVVIEYDESYHNRTIQKQKDIIRQRDIVEHLNCHFIRIG